MILQISILNPAPIPQRGAKLTQMQQRENAAKFRDLLIDLLTERGPMGSRELVELTGSNISTVREYMSKLINEGRAASKRIPNSINGGATWAALYSAGGDLPELKGEVAIQPTLTKYPLHHVRDPLHCFLFGPAKQHNGEMTK